MSEVARRTGARAALWTAVLVLAVLLATVDTRAFGLIPDGKEMLSASAAVSRFFEIGISRDFVNAPRRAGGDAVSRYGMGLSLAEAVPGVVTRLIRAAAPSAPSAPVFVLVPIACLVVAAWATTRALLLLGAAPAWAAASGAGLVLATPLWGYAASDYGEPLQACCLALLLLAVVELRGAPGSRRWQVVAGVAAGLAILTKTLLLIAVAPLLVCVLFGRREERDFLEGRKRDRSRRGAGPPFGSYALPWRLLFSFAGILLLWCLLEFARFGKLFGGYSGETFSYPFLSGLLRLTVFPNKGLFWYAPIVLLAPWGFVALVRRDARLALGSCVSGLSLLVACSAWWAWDGQAGWGPRLLLPALPPFVLLAGLACSLSGRSARVACAFGLVLGFGVNLLGALVPFPAVYALSDVVPPQPILETRAKGTEYEIERGADGILRATAPHHLSLTPEWSPIRVHASLLRMKLRGDVAKSLASGGLPGLEPPFRPVLPGEPAPALLLALRPVRIGWGREKFFEGKEKFPDPWDEATRDQTVRAIDVKDYARVRALGEEILKTKDRASDSSSDPRVAALVAEAERLSARGDAARLSSLSKQISSLSLSSTSLACHPWILFVRSMAEPPGDFSCIPEPQREGFARSLDAARRRGWTLTSWVRAMRTGQP
ncbi:MAG: hypothetical protein PT977_00535 [Acidobacteriota bacterium]|nr:hypothetical protein [Acidobacteriota bacterium]